MRIASALDEKRWGCSRGGIANGDTELRSVSNQPSSAEELLSRRREMKHRIRERQIHALDRSEERHMDNSFLKDQVLEEWTHTQSASRRW